MVREKRPFILPLHDGVFCPEGAVAAVVSKFEHALAKSQFQVKVKIDRYVTGKTKVLVIKENNG